MIRIPDVSRQVRRETSRRLSLLERVVCRAAGQACENCGRGEPARVVSWCELAPGGGVEEFSVQLCPACCRHFMGR